MLKSQQGKGIGTLLIEQSLKHIKDYLSDTNSTLKAILVTTRTDNQAKAFTYTDASKEIYWKYRALWTVSGELRHYVR